MHFSLQQVYFRYSPIHGHWYAYGDEHKFLRIVGTQYQVVDQATLDAEKKERDAKAAARTGKGTGKGNGKSGGKSKCGGKGKGGGKGAIKIGTNA